MEILWEWEHKYAKNENRNEKSIGRTHDNENRNGYFFMCAKFSIGRLDANAIQCLDYSTITDNMRF